MVGFDTMFKLGYKSEEQRKKEAEAYNAKQFPYGEKQREKLLSLLKELLPRFDEEISVYQYLVCKDMTGSWKDQSNDRKKIDQIADSLKFTLKKKNRDDLYLYLALCEADLSIDEKLDYPDIEALKERAEELKKI